VTTNKATYTVGETVTTSFNNMSGNEKDWLAVYPVGAANTWENVIQWDWAGAINGTHTFDALPAGDYEVRIFFNNSYNVEASHKFSVTDNNIVTTVTTNKDIYEPNEEIVTTYENMSENEEDWIAIYAAGTTNEWENVLQWDWIKSKKNGSKTFEALPVGDYEVRVFFNNSYELESSHQFTVKSTELSIESRKEIYDPIELIHVDFENMRGVEGDWIGIFAVGANDGKDNAIEWRDSKSLVNGSLSFNGLQAGAYEARAYFDAIHKKTFAFTVQNQEVVTIMYEDAEDGIDPRWNHYSGKYPVQLLNVGAQGSAHSIRHRAYWENGVNPAGYSFPFGEVDKKMKFLELDMRIGLSSHIFNFGVVVQTNKGGRRIVFASWMNHSDGNGGNDFVHPVIRKPFLYQDYMQVHPGPTDYYLDTRDGSFVHYKINIEKKLRLVEPDIELLSIRTFTTSGGDYDNLSLVSH